MACTESVTLLYNGEVSAQGNIAVAQQVFASRALEKSLPPPWSCFAP